MDSKVGWRSKINAYALAGLFLCLVGCETTPKEEPKVEKPIPTGEIEDLVDQTSVTTPVDSNAEAPVVEKEEPKEERPRVKPKATTLENQVARFGVTVKRGDKEGEWVMSKGSSIATLKEGSRRAILDGVMVFMNGPLVSKKGQVHLNPADIETFVRPAFGSASEDEVLSSRLIVIDPGHGGSEDGAANGEMGLLEKELTLDVSKRLEEHLKEKGYETAMTRYDDRVVSLEERPEIANRAAAGLFVSIHFNASVNKNAQGLETFSLTSEGFVSTGGSQTLGPDARKWPGNDFDYLNAELSLAIQKGVLEKLQRTDRGMKKARFRVLKTLACPGVLVECGFVSNSSEALLVRTPVYREKLALALADAIDGYMQDYAPNETKLLAEVDSEDQ